MLMYNLLEYSKNYTMTSGNLWNYYRDEIDDVNDNNSQGKSFQCKTEIAGKTPALPLQSGNPGDADQPVQTPVPSLNVEVAIPLKYLSIFWRSLDLPLINCEVELELSWANDSVFVSQVT